LKFEDQRLFWKINFDQTVEIQGGHAVAHLVEALRYKPEGRRFDAQWCHWNFALI